MPPTIQEVLGAEYVEEAKTVGFEPVDMTTLVLQTGGGGDRPALASATARNKLMWFVTAMFQTMWARVRWEGDAFATTKSEYAPDDRKKAKFEVPIKMGGLDDPKVRERWPHLLKGEVCTVVQIRLLAERLLELVFESPPADGNWRTYVDRAYAKAKALEAQRVAGKQDRDTVPIAEIEAMMADDEKMTERVRAAARRLFVEGAKSIPGEPIGTVDKETGLLVDPVTKKVKQTQNGAEKTAEYVMKMKVWSKINRKDSLKDVTTPSYKTTLVANETTWRDVLATMNRLGFRYTPLHYYNGATGALMPQPTLGRDFVPTIATYDKDARKNDATIAANLRNPTVAPIPWGGKAICKMSYFLQVYDEAGAYGVQVQPSRNIKVCRVTEASPLVNDSFKVPEDMLGDLDSINAATAANGATMLTAPPPPLQLEEAPGGKRDQPPPPAVGDTAVDGPPTKQQPQVTTPSDNEQDDNDDDDTSFDRALAQLKGV